MRARTHIFGRDSRQVDSREDVGFLPENPYFYKYLTGEETLRFYGKLCGLSGAKLNERTAELLKLVGLEDARHRRLGGYSKGMLQRIGLAQALVQDPRLLVLDEPTAGVDPAGSREIRDLILDFKKRGITVLLCSHLLGQVQEICDRIGILHQGVLVREGKLEDLISIENQTELILENATPELLADIESLIGKSGARLVEKRKPQTTLERFFLEVTSSRRNRNERSMSNAQRPTFKNTAARWRRWMLEVGRWTLDVFLSPDDRPPRRHPHQVFSPARVLALASNTLLELVRLKVFYFLLLFALLIIGSSAFMVRLSFQEQFQMLKDVSLGAMSIFTWLLAVLATAMLLPKDIEDRTLYTILAKPVPRFEYLLGKLLGVLVLLLISTLVMSGMFAIVLYAREQTVIAETLQQAGAAPPEQVQ